MSERDPLIEKLRLRERAEEDVYFAKRDRELLERLHEAGEEEQQRRLREIVRKRCPECGARLRAVAHHGVAVEECPLGHGMWMTAAEMRTVAERERQSWLGRYFHLPKPVV
jgi:uncharacterized protein with PIN domain